MSPRPLRPPGRSTLPAPLPAAAPLLVAKTAPRAAPPLGRMAVSERAAHVIRSLLRGRSKLRLPPPAGRSKLRGGIDLLAPVLLLLAPAVLPVKGAWARTCSWEVLLRRVVQLLRHLVAAESCMVAVRGYCSAEQ